MTLASDLNEAFLAKITFIYNNKTFFRVAVNTMVSFIILFKSHVRPE